MNYKILAIEVFAIFTSYLVFSISFASATNVKVYFGGAPQQNSVQYSPESLVSVSFVTDASLAVTLNVAGTSGIQIDKVIVYKCRGLSPSACMQSVAADKLSGTTASYQWSSLSDTSTGYPQKANLLILVQARSASAFWSGFWYTIERPDSSTFIPRLNPSDEISVNAKNLGDVNLIKSFISTNKMIPFNPQWVTSVVFSGANILYELQAGAQEIETGQFSSSEVPQNTLTKIEKDYAFVLPSSGQTFNPIVLNLNPGYICGNNNCETDKGESQANCCIDCACQTSYYCDASGGCRQNAGISLSLYGTPVTKVSNCYQQHTLYIPVRINNPPTGMSVSSIRYRLGSNPYQPTSCIGNSSTNHIYSCPITVPVVSGCSAGTFKYGPNYINFSITYPNGKATTSKSISVLFPDITIGSYTCGNGVCESSLQESSANCCPDCSCATGYCDYSAASPENSLCRTDPSSSNLHITALGPLQFYTHTTGDSASLMAQITNTPATLSASGQSCSIKCIVSGVECSSTCSISCTKVPSSDASVYNSTCSIGFSISAYDSLKSYSLFPTVNVSTSYSNGSSGTIQKVFSASAPTISIGSHWPGDKKCDPDESQASCCYDCGCPSGQHCNTETVEFFTPGDSCIENPVIDKDVIGTTSFTSTYVEHIINITGHANTKPGGAKISASCVFNRTNSGVPCYPSCWETSDELSPYFMFMCQATVPEINYSNTRFFNSLTKQVTITPNWINLTLKYNNGSQVASGEYSFMIPDVVIDVIPKCGDDYGNKAVCEKSIGESYVDCCLDCGCLAKGSEYICYTGKVANGECVSTSSIQLSITRIEPEPTVKCTIFDRGGNCQFLPSKLYLEIANPPSDLEIEASYRINSTAEFIKLSNLVKHNAGNYSFDFLIDSIPKTTPGKEERTLQLSAVLSYTHNGIKETKSILDEKKFTIERVYTPALASCIEQQKSMDAELSSLGHERDLYIMLSIVFFMLSLYFWYSYLSCTNNCTNPYYYVPCITLCKLGLEWPAVVAGLIGGCGLMFALNKLDSIEGKIKQLEAQKKLLCSSSNFQDLSGSTSGMGNMLYMVGQIYGGYTCLSAMSIFGAQAGAYVGGSSTGTAAVGQSDQAALGAIEAGEGSSPFLDYGGGCNIDCLLARIPRIPK